MNRRNLVILAFLGIAACATSGPESPVTTAKVEPPANTGDPAATEGVIDDVDAPKVPKAESLPTSTNASTQSQVVCRRERTTGSHRLTRVCRTRAEINRTREADQDAIRKLGRRASAQIPE
jgi:hypothetical protein